MSRKGLEVMTFGKRSRNGLLRWMMLLRLYPEPGLARRVRGKLENQELTDSWGNCVGGGGGLLGVVALTFGASLRRLLGSIDKDEQGCELGGDAVVSKPGRRRSLNRSRFRLGRALEFQVDCIASFEHER
ncbi:unnamed protein product [Fusarium graminearum]|nr:unnamed protein product [Fusarium graminearum]